MFHPRPGLRPRVSPGRGYPPQQQDHPGPEHAGREQVLTGQPEQQLRPVVLHRPGEQELVEVLPLGGVHRPPAGVTGHLPQMIRAGLLPLAVSAQLTHRDPEPLRQPAHHGVRRQPHLIGYEPEPRQRAQLDCHTQHVAAGPELAHERLVRAGQREVPDQLGPVDLREAPKPRQFLCREHILSCHVSRWGRTRFAPTPTAVRTSCCRWRRSRARPVRSSSARRSWRRGPGRGR